LRTEQNDEHFEYFYADLVVFCGENESFFFFALYIVIFVHFSDHFQLF